MDMIYVWWFIYFDLPQCVTHNGVVRCVTLGIAKLPHTRSSWGRRRWRLQTQSRPAAPVALCVLSLKLLVTTCYNMLQLSVTVLHFFFAYRCFSDFKINIDVTLLPTCHQNHADTKIIKEQSGVIHPENDGLKRQHCDFRFMCCGVPENSGKQNKRASS